MAEAFDPYRRWLGIPRGERPPNHYALLGLSLFEQDPDAIANAADRQMAYVRTHQTGPHAALTQQLLNELAAARVCLLNPPQKARYDAELKAKQAPASAARQTAPAPVPLAAPIANSAAASSAGLPLLVTAPQTTVSDLRLGAKSRGSKSALPAWLIPAAAGLAAGVLLASIALSFVLSLGGGDRSRPAEQTARNAPQPQSKPAQPADDNKREQPAGENKPAQPAGENKPARRADAEKPAQPADEPTLPAEKSEFAAIFGSIKTPDSLGVKAARLVIWNTHNGYHRDRGALACNVRLLAGGREVWRQENLAVPWAADDDRSLTVALPPERFERVRVEITKWEQLGGGLAEIEILSADGRNLAYGQPAAAGAPFWSGRFEAEHVVDGVTKSPEAETGYWLLPDATPGWIEVDLSLPRPEKPAGVAADKLVIWNQHNGPHNNSATQWCGLTAYAGKRIAWRQERVELPWAPGEDASAELKLPPTPFDRLRIDVTPPEGKWAGLAEVQILAGDKNLARDCPVLGGGSFDSRRREARATDGIVSSAAENVGYWLLPEQRPGWIEIDLACLDADYGAACRQLGLSLALVDGDWQRGLPWLARGDNRSLRRLAQADLERMVDVPDQLAVADGWRELAGQAEGRIQEQMLTRAAWWYRRILAKLHEFRRMQVQTWLDAMPPRSPERDYLFFMPESDSKLWDGQLREVRIVVRGQPSPYGLYMHPAANDSARVAFRLGKRYRRLRGAAAINDSVGNHTVTALTFRVIGDGRELWKSSPQKGAGAPAPFDVDVTGIEKIELFVDCPGDNGYAHGVWVEPRLE